MLGMAWGETKSLGSGVLLWALGAEMLPRLGFQGSCKVATSHQQPGGHLVEPVAAPRQRSMVKIIENMLKIAARAPIAPQEAISLPRKADHGRHRSALRLAVQNLNVALGAAFRAIHHTGDMALRFTRGAPVDLARWRR